MTLEEMEKRLKNLEERQRVTEDLEAIKQLHYHYMNSFMKGEWDEVLKCFTSDCILDVLPPNEPVKGIKEIERVFREILAKSHTGKEGDFVVHPLIQVEGNKAKGNWTMYMMWAHATTWKPLFWVQGAYDAEYIKMNGQWKFASLKHRGRIGPRNDVRIKNPGYPW
jgi:ketosteroid isomerase-like protein